MSEPTLFDSLGKSLNTEIKFVSIAKFRYFDELGKEIKTERSVGAVVKNIICLGKDSCYILQGDLQKIIEEFYYENIEGIEIDQKNLDIFSIWVNPKYLKNIKAKKILVIAKFRAELIKNIMCYYSIFYMTKHYVVKEIKIALSKEIVEDKKKNEIKKGLSRYYHQISHRNYDFFIKYNIIDNYNNNIFKISFKDPNEDEEDNNSKTSQACQLSVEIGNPTHFGIFEVDKDNKDLSYYAYNFFINYLSNTIKVNKYWITKNKIYVKKFNFNEDISMWESWRLEARTSDPFYKNIICIVLRRKFLPPFYNSFQTFHFILLEDISRELYEINPQCFEVIELAVDSIYYSNKLIEKEYILFLQANIDSIMMDEEMILFHQNCLNIITNEIYDYGYEFLYSILVLLEYNTKEKSKLAPIRFALEQKIKLLNSTGELTFELGINPNNIKISKIIKSMINLLEGGEDDEMEINSQFSEKKYTRNSKTKEAEAESDDEDKDAQNNSVYESRIKKEQQMVKEKHFAKKKEFWRRKVYRYLAFCINGGLSDFMFTFEIFIDMVNRVQNNSILMDLNEFIFYSMNICDLDADINDEQTKIYIPSLNEKTNVVFNEEILCVCIKTGWLSKYLSESVKHAPTFMKLLLKKFCTNKILSSIYSYLRLINEQTGEEGANADERNALNVLLPTLVEIYSDIRRCPSTLVLTAKCMCALINKDTDKKNKIILIQEDIVPKIAVYFDLYDFDDKLLIISLELFAFIMPELKLKINEYLSDINGVNLMTNFKNILTKTKAPGTFYSQRVLTKVVTIILSMTNILEAGIKEKLNSPSEIKFYDSLLIILDNDKKYNVIDPIEETSYILEFKVFWLLCLLCFKNDKAKEYLFNTLDLKDFIEKKAEFYSGLCYQIISGIKTKSYSDTKVDTIIKAISKFFEFAYHLMTKDSSKISLMKSQCFNFNKLLNFIDKKRTEFNIGKEFDVFNWINRLYRDFEETDKF